jgi:hypothetical protein
MAGSTLYEQSAQCLLYLIYKEVTILSTRPHFSDEIEDKSIVGIGVALLGKRRLNADIVGTITSMVDKRQDSRVKCDPTVVTPR